MKTTVTKTTFAATLALIITGTQALAATGGANPEGLGLMATLFISFAVLVLLFQLIPGVLLLAGMLKGIFSKAKKTGVDAVESGKHGL